MKVFGRIYEDIDLGVQREWLRNLVLDHGTGYTWHEGWRVGSLRNSELSAIYAECCNVREAAFLRLALLANSAGFWRWDKCDLDDALESSGCTLIQILGALEAAYQEMEP